jgi:hypothetical protein
MLDILSLLSIGSRKRANTSEGEALFILYQTAYY